MNQWELDEMVKNAEREDAEKRKLNHDWVVVRLKPWQSVEDVKNDIECIQCGNANVRVYVGNIRLIVMSESEEEKDYQELDKYYNLYLDGVVKLMSNYKILLNFEDITVEQNVDLLNFLQLKRIIGDDRTALELLKIDTIRRLGGNYER